jgi:hypothetical protein
VQSFAFSNVTRTRKAPRRPCIVPEPLIESRYAMLGIAFWSLLRRDTSWAAECASAMWNAAISLFVLDRIVHGMLL